MKIMNSRGAIFKRVKQEPSDGRTPIQYSIQLMHESLIGEAARFWAKYFVPRSNLSMSLDERLGKEISRDDDWITKFLAEGITLAAFLEDGRGNRGTLIGLNILILERKEHSDVQDLKEDDQSEAVSLTEGTKLIIQTVEYVEAKADVFTLYNCSSYIYDMILVVAPEYERRGIAGELLQAVGEVCRMTGTPVCASVFISEASQKVAARCGFQTLADLDLTTYRVDGEIVYPDPKWPLIKLMAKRYF